VANGDKRLCCDGVEPMHQSLTASKFPLGAWADLDFVGIIGYWPADIFIRPTVLHRHARCYT
jgi:hypothetical protein